MSNRSKKITHLEVLEKYYKEHLSAKAYRQLYRATENPDDRFWTEVLLPQVFIDPTGNPVNLSDPEMDNPLAAADEMNAKASDAADMADRPGYTCLSSSKKLEGRSQFPAGQALASRGFPDGVMPDPRRSLCYFTNYLRFGVPGDDTWNSPSKRITLGPLTHFTIEFDPPKNIPTSKRIEILERQMAWFRRSGNSTKSCPIYKMIAWANQFSDFRGLVVAYSGNKSLHFIFLFDTSHAMTESVAHRDQFRGYYQDCFSKLATAFDEIMEPNISHDPAMVNPEQFRRLPNGVNLVMNQKEHLFSVPVGTEVLQATLFEHIVTKAPPRAKRRFIDPVELTRQAVQSTMKPPNRTGHNVKVRPWVHDDEYQYCFDKLDLLTKTRTGPDGYPRLAAIENDSRLVAKFYANAFDRNPNVIILGGMNQTVLCGSQIPDQNIDIGLTLQMHIRSWRRQWQIKNPGYPKPGVGEEFTSTPVVKPDFSDGSFNLNVVRNRFRDELNQLASGHNTVLVRAPEGFGKTTAAMMMLPIWAVSKNKMRLDQISDQELGYEQRMIRSRCSAVATASYDQAEEKCAAYNVMHDPKVSLGLVFHSFSFCYEKALIREYGDDWSQHKINTARAGADDQRSVIRAIQNKQPDVWARIATMHHEMLAPMQEAGLDSHVVLFMVHDVLHQWTEGGLSRLFSHPDFIGTPIENIWKLVEETTLAIVVHDELEKSHFIEMAPLANIVWCEQLFATGGPWSEDFLHLGKAKKSWSAFTATNPGGVAFDKTVSIYRSELRSDQNVGIGPVERYGLKPNGNSWEMYAVRHFLRYAYRRREWWNGLSDLTIMLTTEALPTDLFRQSTFGHQDVVILECDLPITDQGKIEAHILPNLSAKDNAEIVLQMRDETGISDLHAICNNRDNITDSTSYPKAKGTNDLANRNIIQVMNFVAAGNDPTEISEYDELQAINYVFGINNAIRLRHVDLINQIAGRNLGRRYQGMKHILVMAGGLWDLIYPRAIAYGLFSV